MGAERTGVLPARPDIAGVVFPRSPQAVLGKRAVTDAERDVGYGETLVPLLSFEDAPADSFVPPLPSRLGNGDCRRRTPLLQEALRIDHILMYGTKI